VLSKLISARAPSRRDVAHAARAAPARCPPWRSRPRPRRPRQPAVPGPCSFPMRHAPSLGIFPAVRTPWTAPYRPVHAADRRSVGTTPPYAHRSRWPCYGSISGITATSPGGLSHKNLSVVRSPRTTPTRRPPLPPPPCAHASTSSHRRLTFPTCSLGSVAPSQAAHCHPCSLPSMEPEPPPAVAVRPHRRLLCPNYDNHPTLGEHVVDPDPSPGREHRRSRRIPANRAASHGQGWDCKGPSLPYGFCAI
jgi:hypothetical protein